MTGHGVFPRPEPQENNFHLVLSGFQNQLLVQAEVKFPFLWFDQFPIDWYQYGIQVEGCQIRPNRLHVFQRGSGRISKFSAANEICFLIHIQLGGGLGFHKSGKLGLTK